jgi:hypothetical protein
MQAPPYVARALMFFVEQRMFFVDQRTFARRRTKMCVALTIVPLYL